MDRKRGHRRYPAAIALALLVMLLWGGAPARALDASDESLYEQYTWDELIGQLLAENHVQEGTCALGYRNTVTGEEHFYNADLLFTGASLYKAPLNMYLSEQITKGEFSWDDTILWQPYSVVQPLMLTYSNNEYSLAAVNMLGGWEAFRGDIAEYVGEDPSDPEYLAGMNAFTARQYVNCMATLATEPERFPGVIDCLLDSAPGLFLEYGDVPYEIAQKYGNNSEEGHLFHAQGIIYTDDPIAVAVLTAQLAPQRAVFSGFTELVCGYTQYHTGLRLEEEAAAAAESARLEAERQTEEERAAEEARLKAERQAEEERAAREQAAAETPRPTAEPAASPETVVLNLGRTLLPAGIAGAAVLCVLFLFGRRRGK